MKTFYDLCIEKRDGSILQLKDLKGKVILIVNTATGCGFTPQYAPIEELYKKYHSKGLEILDIPCNQFGNQAPGSDEEIHDFCTLHYNTTFEQMKKADVNGEKEIPLFTFLKSKQPFKGFGEGPMAENMDKMLKNADPNYEKSSDIKWNFTKFVVDQNGEVVGRYEPTHDLKDLEKTLVKLLKL